MKTTKLWCLFSTIILGSFGASGQVLQLELGVGPSFLETTTVYTFTVADGGYGFGPTVLSFHALAKLSLPVQRLAITAGVSYSHLSGSGALNWVGVPSDPLMRSDFKSSITTASLGVQWVVARGSVEPYLGMNLLLVSLSDINRSNRYALYTKEDRLTGWTRFGMGVAGGIEIPAFPLLSFEFGGNYNFNWLFYGSSGNPGLVEYGIHVGILVAVL